MEFCKKCGGILIPKKTKNRVVFVCRNCGRKYDKGTDIKVGEKVHAENNIKIIDKKEENLPITENQCPKCGNKEAFWWIQQTRSIDEPPTRFYKCTKCGYTWREYS
ncbi:MAG TPA: transcription factor S [Candidatus Aenigmarchaeota archaeon]|nr:transcription factor S [Candidatus Aenigmarchaeota archaeon]RLJ04992.1 MAG: transcription factor S [Candidatus Aenigmarchaeota archaeon]HDI06528.1 transcription factor S [Candidatus Aenigmarchaeota archaeon]